MALSVADRAAVALELGAAVLLMWPLVWAEQEVPVQIGQRVSDGLPDACSGLVA